MNTIIAFVCLLGLLGAQGQHSSTALVHSRKDGSGVSLAQALQDRTITRLVIVPERLDVAAELEGLPGRFSLDRNVTVTGARGTQTIWDQQFLRARLQLCGSCAWTFTNITVANDNKGSALDNELFVAAALGARLILQDANVLRLACPSPADTSDVLSLTPPSAAFQTGSGREPTTQQQQQQQQQQHSTRDVVAQGRTYLASLFTESFSTDVPPSQEGRANTGGYALLWKDTARPCSAYVQESCLDTQSMDTCTHALTAQLLAGQQGQGAERGLQPGVLAAAVVVPVFVAALAAAGVAFWCHRRRTASPGVATTAVKTRRKAFSRGLLGADDTDVERGGGGGGPNSDPDGSGGPVKGEAEPLSRRPLGLQAGWSVARACTTPYLGQVEDDKIEFGELVGSGSFGRVFLAKWAGRDVAVKVIEHNTDTTVPVEREVSLMLSFNHPHIVRAFHFVTRVHTSEVMPHTTNSSSNKDTDVTKSNSVGSSGSNPRAAAAGPAAQHSSGGGGSGRQPAARVLPPLPPTKPATDGSSSASSGSNNSRASAGGGGSSDKRSGVGSVSNPQLLLVQRLPSLTGATPRLVHKVETWLVQEYCDCGTLAAVASEWKSEPECDQKMLERLQLLQDCARGLQELHSRNVVHGDLNARNVLLSSSAVAPLGVVAKLADLGLSRIVRSHRSHHSTNTVGTMSHVAPELLRYGHMSTAGDIYAFGIVMWELYTGQPAFSKLHVGQFFEAVVVRNLRPKIPRGMAADYQLLMQSCWSADPADRPSCERLLNCLKLMVQVRQQRLGVSVTTGASGAATPCSSLLLYPQQQQQQQATMGGPGTFAGGFSAPLPAAVDPGGSCMQHAPQQQLGASIPSPAPGGQHGSGLSAAAAAAAASSHACHSADGYSTPAARAAPAVSALPGLLALLRERVSQPDQQQLMREMAGGQRHSSCPADTRGEARGRPSTDAGLWEYVQQRLTPINTGRRASAEPLEPRVSHTQSDPLPCQGGYSMQQQILLQLEQQRQRLLQGEQYLLSYQQQQQQQLGHSSELPSGSFLGFPEAAGVGGAGSSNSSGMPTPWLSYQRSSISSSAGTHTTPLTGLTYYYPSTSSGGSSSAAGSLPLPAAVVGSRRLSTGSSAGATTAPLPWCRGSNSIDSTRRLSGPLPRLPGAAVAGNTASSSLVRSGSLGAAWYWQRNAPGDDLNTEGPNKCEGDDAGSVTDQDGLVDQLGSEAQQQGVCLDVVAKLQTELLHV